MSNHPTITMYPKVRDRENGNLKIANTLPVIGKQTRNSAPISPATKLKNHLFLQHPPRPFPVTRGEPLDLATL